VVELDDSPPVALPRGGLSPADSPAHSADCSLVKLSDEPDLPPDDLREEPRLAELEPDDSPPDDCLAVSPVDDSRELDLPPPAVHFEQADSPVDSPVECSVDCWVRVVPVEKGPGC
jgi:hypothetical protein